MVIIIMTMHFTIEPWMMMKTDWKALIKYRDLRKQIL